MNYHDENDVFGLNVPVENFVHMHVINSLEKIFDNVGGGFFVQDFFFAVAHEGIKLTITSELHKGVKMSLILKKAI